MVNAHGSTVVLISMAQWKFRVFGITQKDGTMEKNTMDKLAEILPKGDEEASSKSGSTSLFQQLNVHVYMRSTAYEALNGKAPRNVHYLYDGAKMDALLLQMSNAGLFSAKPRPLVSRVISNVRSEDEHAVGVRIHTALWECGVQSNLVNDTVYEIPRSVLRRAIDSGDVAPTTVTISIASSLTPLPVMFCVADADEMTQRQLTQLLKLVPRDGSTKFVVTVLIDTLYTDAAAGTYRRRVYFHPGGAAQAILEAAAKGPLRGVLRRGKSVALTEDVYPTRILTNACGPHMDAFAEVAKSVVVATGATFMGVENFEHKQLN